MRGYGKVSPQFWFGDTGKALRKSGVEAQLVGLYLMTSPHATMLGLYYLPRVFMAHETGLGLEGATKGLQGCIDAGFCKYDDASETVWVVEMARYQIADELKDRDLRIKGVQSEYDSLPGNPYLGEFFDTYASAFRMTSKRDGTPPLKAPSKPLASQEQEQEQEQEKEQDQTHVEQRVAPPAVDVVGEVFAFWQQTFNSPKSVLDDKRKKLIRAALKGYPKEQLFAAIKGCAKSEYHMGKNAGGTIYNGLGLILRSAEYIDKFIAINNKNSTGPESIEEQNARIVAELAGTGGFPFDDMTIDMET